MILTETVSGIFICDVCVIPEFRITADPKLSISVYLGVSLHSLKHPEYEDTGSIQLWLKVTQTELRSMSSGRRTADTSESDGFLIVWPTSYFALLSTCILVLDSKSVKGETVVQLSNIRNDS